MCEYPGFPNIFPVPIRDDVTVRIQGIPPDLTREEAEKIGRVVFALVSNPQPKDRTNDE